MKLYVGVREPITAERYEKHYGWSPEEAARLAQQSGATETRVRVYVTPGTIEIDEHGAMRSGSDLSLEGVECHDLKHEARHSPDGLEWGYSGSGPADLARSILADFLGYVPADYQRFKQEVVAHLPREAFMITESVVRRWVTENYPKSLPKAEGA